MSPEPEHSSLRIALIHPDFRPDGGAERMILHTLSALAGQVHVDPAILAYVSRLSEESRRHPHVSLGLSIRGGLAYIRCAKVWAVSQGRDHVLPDDIKDLAHPVLSHRLMLNDEAQFTGVEVSRVVDELLDDVAAPAHRLA